MQRDTAKRVFLGTAAGAMAVSFSNLLAGWFSMTAAKMEPEKMPGWVLPAMIACGSLALVFFAMFLHSIFRDEVAERTKAASSAAARKAKAIEEAAKARGVTEERMDVWRKFRAWLARASARWFEVHRTKQDRQHSWTLMRIHERILHALPERKIDVIGAAVERSTLPDNSPMWIWSDRSEKNVRELLVRLDSSVTPEELKGPAEEWDEKNDRWERPPPAAR